MTYLVIRVRSDRGVTKKIRDTMTMLNLTRVNHAVLVPKTASYDGMLQKVKDYVEAPEDAPFFRTSQDIVPFSTLY